MKRILFLIFISSFLFLPELVFAVAINYSYGHMSDPDKPNVIIILTDDLGYGDLECYGNEEIETPNINDLAYKGCLFTDAYVPAAVCTPARYGLLTGRYPWRTFLHSGVIADSPLLIDPDRYTLPKLFKDAGYATAAIGKWHLGFGTEREAIINYNQAVSPGPIEVGFDYFFGIPVGHFYPPDVFMRNHMVVGLEADDPISIIKPQNGTPYMVGGDNARFDRSLVSKVLFGEAESFIIENKSNPFFLYLAVTKPHTPFDRHDDFKNSGSLSHYGDVIREVDFRVGKLMNTLDSLGLSEKTMVIFTSDNGGIPPTNGYFKDLGLKHETNTPLRGYKGNVWDGGVRVPFIIHYPDRVEAGKMSNTPFSLTDLMASMASLLGRKLPGNSAEDSFDVLPALFDEGPISDHGFVIQGRAGVLGLRWGEWIYISDPGGGDYNDNTSSEAPVQLYRITDDISEQHNLYNKNPDKVYLLSEMLKRITETSGNEVW